MRHRKEVTNVRVEPMPWDSDGRFLGPNPFLHSSHQIIVDKDMIFAFYDLRKVKIFLDTAVFSFC